MTMEALAELAGVSVSTVSRALRDRPGVSPETARRVQELARQHRFRPNQSAVRLRQGRTQTVAVAVPALNSWYCSRVIAGAQGVLAAAGFDTLVAPITGPSSLGNIVRDTSPRTGPVDGIILVNLGLPDESMDELRDRGVGVVLVGREHPEHSSIRIDDEALADLATSHLLGLGHRTIGLVMGRPSRTYWYEITEERQAGYRRALAAAGAEIRPDLEVAGNFSIKGAMRATRVIMSQPSPPTALFCMSDQMAYGAIAALSELGLQVPHDVSVVGVDDHVTSGVMGLTTIHQDAVDIGVRAAELTLAALEHPDEVRREEPTFHLVVRRSTRRRR